MTCPKCGLQPQSDQKFCRACGASLQTTTQPLAGSASVSDLETTSAIISKSGKRRGINLVLWGFIIMLVGTAIGIVGKKLLQEDIVAVVGVLISLVGMFIMAYPHLSPSRRKTTDSNTSSQPEVLTPSRSAQYLSQGSKTEYVPSITEKTTDLLKTSVPSRPNRKENDESKT